MVQICGEAMCWGAGWVVVVDGEEEEVGGEDGDGGGREQG